MEIRDSAKRLFGRAKSTTGDLVASSKDKVADIRSSRQRNELLRELGELCWADRTGAGDDNTAREIDRIVNELKELEMASGDDG